MNFILYSELSNSHNTRLLIYLIEGGLANGKYKVTCHINYEFLPASGLDFFNTAFAPIADPNTRAKLSGISDSMLLDKPSMLMLRSVSNNLPELTQNQAMLQKQTQDVGISNAGTGTSNGS